MIGLTFSLDTYNLYLCVVWSHLFCYILILFLTKIVCLDFVNYLDSAIKKKKPLFEQLNPQPFPRCFFFFSPLVITLVDLTII